MADARAAGSHTPEWWPGWCRRVIFVAPRYPETSGGSRYIDNFASALAAVDVDAEVLSIHPGSARKPPGSNRTPAVHTIIRREQLHRNPTVRTRAGAWSRAVGVPLLAFKSVDRVRYRRELRRRLQECGDDTLLVYTHALAKRVADEAGVDSRSLEATVVGQHHSSFESLTFEPGLEKAILESFADVDAFTALSAEDAEQFARLIPVPCVGVPNPSSPSFAEAVSSDREWPPVAVALARFTEEKQLDLMIRAFASATASENLGHWRLDIYGDGYQRRVLEETIASSEVGHRVRLRGTTTDAARALSRASVHLLTSRYEGFGLSVLEAAQTGVVTIAFDCSPGLHRLMNDVGGVLVPSAEGELGMTEAIRGMLSDPARLPALGLRARDGARAYSPERVLRDWSQVLRIAHERARSRRGPSSEANR